MRVNSFKSKSAHFIGRVEMPLRNLTKTLLHLSLDVLVKIFRLGLVERESESESEIFGG